MAKKFNPATMCFEDDMAKKFNPATMRFEDDEEKSTTSQKQQNSSHSSKTVVNRNDTPYPTSSSSHSSYNQSRSSLNPRLDKLCGILFGLSMISILVGFIGEYFVSDGFWVIIWVAIGAVLFGIGYLIMRFS